MEVVAVVVIVGRAKHGRKRVAGAPVHGAQEGALGKCAPPSRLYRHHAAVGERKGGDVDGVGMAVLGETR